MPQVSQDIAVTDLLGRPPGWLLRSGISLVFIVVVLGLLISAFIHYPDRLTGQVVLGYERPPVALSPLVAAPIDTVLIQDRDTVTINQLLAVLDSDADWQEVLRLDNLLEEYTLNDNDGPIASFIHLGTLQSGYIAWANALQAYQHYWKNNGLQNQSRAIEDEKQYTQDLIRIGEGQLDLLDKQIDIETSDYIRQRTLADQGVISIQEIEEKEKSWLGIRQQRESMAAGLVQYHLKISALKHQQKTLGIDHKDALFNLKQRVTLSGEELRGQLQNWKEQRLIKAPITGQVVFPTQLIEKEILVVGQPLLSLIPLGNEQKVLTARLRLAAQGLGKIIPGDRLIIQLDAYPQQEYGTISTRIQHITALPQSNADGQAFYQISALIAQPITTSYGKHLPAKVLMSGTGTVITANRSLLARVFEQLLSLIETQNL
jgi:multidrug resistance efflux pump